MAPPPFAGEKTMEDITSTPGGQAFYGSRLRPERARKVCGL
jgi:hypothetical protein